MTVINLGNLKFTWKGAWAQTTAYNKDDIVKYGPSVYVCIDAHTSASVFADNVAKFEVMSEGLESAGAARTCLEYSDEVRAHGAADTAVLKQHHLFFGLLD